MTVIFACTFPGGAAIAGDTLMHNPETNERVMNAPKVLSISQRVSVAQAGSFNGTGEVWTKLEQLPRQSATPTTIAEAIRSFATPVYQWKSIEGPAVMRYLVAGLEADGTPAIRWLEFSNNFGGVTGPCQIAALGTLSNVQEVANQKLRESLKPFANIVMLDQWCKRVVAAEAAASPHAVGFPAILIVMKDAAGFGKQVGPEDAPDPAYEVHWP